MDYEEAASIMERHANKVRGGTGIVSTHNHNCKRLKYQTSLRKVEVASVVGRPADYVIRYFNTDIIRFSDDQIEVNDGGFFSRSTLDRFNEFLPAGFRFFGRTFPELKLARPLGFMITPDGIFPYTSRRVFIYNKGYKRWESSGTTDAYEVARSTASYVDSYLTDLFSGKKEFDVGAHVLADRILKDARELGFTITNYITYKFLSAVVTDGITTPPSLNTTMSLSDISKLLAYRGFEIFKRPRTRVECAQRLEDVITYDGNLPVLHKQKLYSCLRKLLMESLVDRLGFDELEWNRR